MSGIQVKDAKTVRALLVLGMMATIFISWWGGGGLQMQAIFQCATARDDLLSISQSLYCILTHLREMNTSPYANWFDRIDYFNNYCLGT